MKTKSLIICVLSLLLYGMMSCVMMAEIAMDRPSAVSGDGCMYQTHEDGFKIIVLHGNWYEMGRQYGELMADDIADLYTLSSLVIMTMLGEERAAAARELMRQQLAVYPKRFHDLMRGMAEGAELTMEEIAFVENIVNMFPAIQEGLFCSTLVVWDDYTPRGELLMARNFDFPEVYSVLSSYLCLVVFNPTDGSVPTATFGYAGQLGCVQAFNREGLVLEVNVAIGFPEENAGVRPDRITIPLLLTQMALDSENLEQMETAIRTMRSNFPLLNTIADTQRCCTYEMGVRDVVRRDVDAEGLNTTTNFIGHPLWKITPSGDNRQSKIRAFAETHKGRIDRELLKTGWQSWTNWSGTAITTLYQFIYEPATRTLSLRLPNASETWTDVDLKPFFIEHD